MAKKRVICIDFDGVVHAATSQYRGPGIVADGPTADAELALGMISREFTVVIHSARANSSVGKAAIAKAMKEWDLPYDRIEAKPGADYYIDDRAVRFAPKGGDGWGDVLSMLLSDG